MKKFYNSNKWLLFIAAVLFFFGSTVQAQYFGRNKVQYEDFDFKVLDTEHYKIHYYHEEKEPVFDAAYMLERWYERQKKVFGIDLDENQPIILYANHPDFQQTNVISGIIPQGVGGVTEGMRNRIVIPLTGVYSENDHVLGHELVHAFQYTLIKESDQGLRASSGLPLWFIEGLAEYLSIGNVGPLTSMWMRDALINNDLPTIDEISSNQKYFPYRYGHALWSYIAGKYGDSTIVKLIRNSLGIGFGQAFKKTIGVKLDTLSKEWQASIREQYEPGLNDMTYPENLGRDIIKGGGGINLSPVISPDGEYIAFLSRRELFSMDLYMADAETGEIIKKLVSTRSDEHFDALRFMNSAGSWSPNSDKFAFIIIEEGDNRIAVLDVESGEIEEKIDIPGVDAITYISYSHDGSRMVISGTKGGINDLYIYDTETGNFDQVTNDRYAEIQPSWGPEDKRIVYSTDMGESTDFDNYVFSKMSIAVHNLETRETELISFGDDVKHIDPYFSEDGSLVYFIADPDGISNLYSYNMTTGEYRKLTNIATGISGLTELSPAMSFSPEENRFALAIFNKTNYFIATVTADELEGETYAYDRDIFLANVTLPVTGGSGSDIVADYIDTHDEYLPDGDNFTVDDYHPSLHLIYIGQTSVGIAVDRFGTGIGGGASFLWSDILGNYQLAAAAQVSGSYKDIGGEVMYINRDSRWNWGASVGHIPYRTAGLVYDTTRVNGELGQEVSLVYQRVFIDRINGLLEYPLSTNRRFEFSGGYTRISYDYEANVIIADRYGRIIKQEDREYDAPSGLNLFSASAAYVGDYSYFGFTSPVDGSRYRLEAEPTAGTLQYVTFLADYRKYLFFNPVTIAARFYHLGRYFGDADNDRLSPYILGYETWIRGYSLDSYDLARSRLVTQEDGNTEVEYPELDRLLGSKVGVINLEVRLPFFGTDQFGLIDFPYLPTELVGFFDGGVAWTQDEKPDIKWTRDSSERVPVFSTGLAARVNVLGYLVVQVYYAYPFQRPDKGSHFGFVIAPGW